VHLDVADGTYTPNTLWHNAAELFTLQAHILIEVHLMVAEPETVIDAWIGAGAKRLIVHVDTIKDFKFIKARCDQAKVLLTLAISPTIPWTELVPYMKENVVSYQVLAVHPGLAGQDVIDAGPEDHNYVESSYDAVRHIRDRLPWCDIEVDGGVRVGTAKKFKEAGANLLAAASAIFSAPDIKKAIEELEEDVA
jgi:ribulose-phosphate 3-epimerase